MKLRLARLESNADAVRGVLYIDGRIRFATLERPWLNNSVMKSCIPTGKYTCEITHSPRFGRVFEVKGVPGRSAILIHAGNTSADSTGCILLGMGFTDRLDRLEIHDSQMAIKRFMNIMDGKESFELEVVDLCFSEPKPIEGPKIL